MKNPFVVAALLCATAMVTAADKPDKELEPFQGTWAIESIIRNGQEVPEDVAQRLVLVVKGNERIIKEGDEVKSKGTFKIDASKKLKTIDITVSEGPLAGKTYPGVYELKDQTLTICLALEGDDRPDDLTSKEGSNRLLQVHKKAMNKADPVKEPELRTELVARRKADQGDRLKMLAVLQKSGGKPEGEALEQFQAIVSARTEQDAKNGEWLKGVVKKHGWPGYALVGKDGAEGAFIIAQHFGSDSEFQKKALEMLAAAVKTKDANPTHLAYLTDRIRVAAGEKQKYGTEVEEKDGMLVAAPIEDETKVDERRKEVGLPPLAESLKQARKDRGYPDKK
jgi:uncharacterized protein (TIGR03067 family)